MRRWIALSVCVLAALPFGSSGAAQDPMTLGALARREIIRQARAVGADPAVALATPQTFDVLNADGSTVSVTMTTAEILERVDGIALPAERRAGPGLADGVPETLAGDLTHAYLDIGFGIPSRYSVTTSTVVPATPGAGVNDPVTGLPLFTEYGGPLIQVKGGGWVLGGHTAGYALGGINVDLADGGPYVFPSVAIIYDGTIDFAGHGSVTQPCLFSFFGICLARLGLVLGDGAALFDSTLPAGIPIVP